jgi:short-subunit dehydrogenase
LVTYLVRCVMVQGYGEDVDSHDNLQQKFLEKNAKVYMAARSSQKTTDALKHLKEETGRDVALLPMDLSDLHSVRAAADLFMRCV